MSKQIAATQSLSVACFKWGTIFVLLVAGIAANHYYQSVPFLYRLLVGLGWVGVIIFIASQTSQGKRFIEFSTAARQEVQRMVWPNKQETLQSTLGVLVMVAVMGIILWALDALLLKFVAWLTGYGAS